MKQNMGMLDRTLRVLTAVTIATLYFTMGVSNVLFWILWGVAGIFLMTSTLSFCPLYAMFGINTCKKNPK